MITLYYLGDGWKNITESVDEMEIFLHNSRLVEWLVWIVRSWSETFHYEVSYLPSPPSVTCLLHRDRNERGFLNLYLGSAYAARILTVAIAGKTLLLIIHNNRSTGRTNLRSLISGLYILDIDCLSSPSLDIEYQSESIWYWLSILFYSIT